MQDPSKPASLKTQLLQQVLIMGEVGPACTVEFVSETDGVCNEYLSSFSLGCISRPRLQFVVFGDEPAMGERNKEYHQVKLAEVRLRAKICFLALENLWRE